jgi:RimJ/RimL family protein N-acetyltransferase
MPTPLLAPSAVPVIETERLLLRGHRLSDEADCFAMWSDPEVTRFIGGRPSTREEVWSRLLRYAGHWALLGYGYWALTERGSGRFLGEAGLADFHRALEPSFGDAPEIGWALVPHAHGRGLATEAVKAIVTWGEANLRPARTVCMIGPENFPSLRVAEKCGFREYGRATYHGAASVLFEKVASPA